MMTGRGGLATASSGNTLGGSGSVPGDHSNQPMDLAQKTSSRPMEGSGVMKSGGATLVHYNTGVAQILTTSGAPSHVVTAKSVCRTESMGVGGQTVTLVSRTSANPAALNLASSGTGGGTGPSVRTVSHPPGSGASNVAVTSSSPAHLTSYHIPRGAAAVANMAAPRSQVVATPIMRTTGQPVGQPSTGTGPRGSVVSQRVVPASSNSGWGRGAPTPAHTGKVSGPPMHPGVPGTSLSLSVPRGSVPVQRAGQPGGSITTYHAGVRSGNMASGSVRGQVPTTMRGGMVSSDPPRVSSSSKAVHITQPIVQPQKYSGNMTGVIGSVTRGVPTGPGVTAGSTGTLYSQGNPMVTTVAGPAVNAQSAMRTPAPPTISVRITTAPVVPSDTSSSQVTSQAVTNIGALAMTTPSGTTGTILPHPTMQRTPQEHHVPLKTPIVRTPVAPHHSTKAGVQTQTLAFPDGPKVITQPAQGPPLALTQISGLASVPTQKAQVSAHSVQHPQAASVQHRPGGSVVGSNVGRVMGGPTIPVAKVMPQQASSQSQGPVSVAASPRVSHGQVRAQSPGQAVEPQPAHTSVFLQRTHPGSGVTVTSGVPVTQGERVVTTMSQYSIGPQFYYEQSQNAYQYVPTSVQGAPLRVAPSAANAAVGGGVSGSVQGGECPPSQGTIPAPSAKPNASPRPSILRKRPDNDGTPLKAVKNLTSTLSLPMPSPPSPKRPDSRGNGNASSGSTTISANSSPGLQIEEMDGSSNNPPGGGGGGGVHTPPNLKQEPPEDATIVLPRPPVTVSTVDGANALPTTLTVPQPHLTGAGSLGSGQVLPDGISPRKKPRKQQLMGNELQEARSSEDDMDHHTVKKFKRDMAEDHHDVEGTDEEGEGWSEPGGGGSSIGSCGNGNNAVSTTVVITNRPSMSLLNSFRQTWKPRHNHFIRHTDVKPKDEKRMTVNEIANQKMALQRVNGWKVVHLSGQVDDLVDLEGEVVERFHMLLTSLEKRTHPRKPYKDFEKDVNRLSELVKANIQRSKIIKDQMIEARSQMHKLFDHKGKIVDIMTKYSCKRSVRKKEKS
ncbi:histone deacetylase complex subunit SAP130-A-like isoform X2 [Macrobrachium nipponense]|uniref:histone deacetylase complex subunit SAP130-A-like isoform X2 n=1 Tax=Macrobrachium nipponense TaxID=159736 RepID=UPI0030C855E4